MKGSDKFRNVSQTKVEYSFKSGRFINIRNYVILFSINMLLISVVGSYIRGVTLFIERQFGLSGHGIGVFNMAYSMAIMPTTLTLAHVSKNWNHARIVGIGACFYCFASFMHALPHFVYGTQELYRRDISNGSDVMTCFPNRPKEECVNVDYSGRTSSGPLKMFFLAGLTRGFSQAPFYSLGMAYTYMNAETPQQSALYIGIVSAVRSIGDLLGFWLAAILSAVPIDLKNTSLSPGDPLWLGAWWLGFILTGILLFIFGVPLLFFPKSFKSNESSPMEPVKRRKHSENKTWFDTIRNLDVVQTLLALVSDPIYSLSMFVSCTLIMRGHGFGIFFNKIINIIYQKSAHTANTILVLISGVGAIGCFLMGYISSRLNSTRRICYLYACCAGISLVSLLAMMHLGCESMKMTGNMKDYTLDLKTSCNSHCECGTNAFRPVCGANETNYFSACHAGCPDNTLKGCVCSPTTQLRDGWCTSHCKTFIPYIIAVAVISLAMGISPGRLLMLRVTPDDLKPFGLALNSFTVNLFGLMPAGLVFGGVVDSTCILWRNKGCGRRGACWLYDTGPFWNRLHGLMAGLATVSFIITGVVAHRGRSYEDPEPHKLITKHEKGREKDGDDEDNEIYTNEKSFLLEDLSDNDEKRGRKRKTEIV